MSNILGKKVRDTVSGFEGIAVAKTQWINGCVRYHVQPKVKDDNTYTNPEWFDVEQLEVLDEESVDIKPRKTGGDRKDPPRIPVGATR